jgi:hypothetical protein
MQHCARALVLSACLLSVCAFAQENRIIRVGVPMMKNQAGRSVPGNLERDRLVKALNDEKPDKKLHIKILGVPLEGMPPDDVGAEARQKNCDYVVYTTLIELQASTDPAMPVPGTLQSRPNGVWTNPNNPETRTLNPEYRATVEYKLYRMGKPDAISVAAFSNRQIMPEADVVSQVMDQIANRVFAEIKKGPPPLGE